MRSVAERKHRYLRAGHALLDDQPGACGAELAVAHHRAHRRPGLVHRLGYDHALAQGQAVGLHHDRGALGLHIGQRRVQAGKGLVFGGGDVILGHQVLGKDLAGLDDRGVFPGAKGGDAGRLQCVHHAKGQRVVRSHHHKIHRVFPGPGHHGLHIGGGDGDALGDGGDAAVARGAVEFMDRRALLQLPADGVLPPASADNQYFHHITSLCVEECSPSRTGARGRRPPETPRGTAVWDRQGSKPSGTPGDQWWNRRIPVKAMTMPYLLQVSMT